MRTTTRRFAGALITSAIAIAAVTACSPGGGTTADGEELVKLRVATTAPGDLTWSWYYIPQYMGYYEDEGLDVEIVPLNTGVTQSLLSGQLDIGGAGFDFVAQGAEVDGLKWYMMTDRHIFAPVVLDSSSIESVADLAGKRIGINEPNDSFDADFVLTANGLEQGDYELIPIGESAPAAKAMEAGQIDAMIIPAVGAYLQATNAIEEDLRILDSPVSENFYNTGLMAQESFLDENRDVAIRFARAIAKGMIWLNENPDRVAEIIFEKHPQSAADVDAAKVIVNRSREWQGSVYQNRGNIDWSVLQTEVDTLANIDLVEAYDASKLYDDSFEDDIWDFDVDAVIAEAKAGKRSS